MATFKAAPVKPSISFDLFEKLDIRVGLLLCPQKSVADESWETGLIGGVEKQPIKIVDYDNAWPRRFEKHARIIAAGTAQ